MITTEYRLDEVCYRLSSGKSIKASQIFEKGSYPVFGGNGIRGYTDTFNFDGECAIIGRQGAYCGNVQFYKGRAYMTEHAVVVCGNEKSSTKFLGLVLQKMDLGRLSHQAAQPGLSVKVLAEQKVILPPIEVQTRIAQILTTYDDLIENNQKQIKLLEEAAQRLYKEWFVDLRFPGYETTPITDGIPEGWIASTVGSICDLKKDTVLASKIAADTPYIGLEHMPRVDFCLSNWGTAEDATSNKFRYAENDIIFGKIRPYFHKVGFTLNSGVVSTDSFVMEVKNDLWGLLLMTVFDKAFVDYTYQTCKEGAKMPRADWNQMKKYPVLVPCDDVRKKFEDYIWTVTRRIKGLALQNRALAEARDRLLPKLMNGEIEV